MNDPAIGERTEGRFMRRSRWYICAVCGHKEPEERTTIPDPPHPKAGLRICVTRCLDDIDYQTAFALNPPLPSTSENLP